MQTEGRASLNDANADRRRRRQLGLFAAVAFVVLAVDIVTKIIAMSQLADREPIRLAGGLLTLLLVRNSGAAFGLAEGYTIILSLVALAVVVVVLRLSRTLRSTPWAIALGLLLGGAFGNLSDRIFREPGFLRGHVVDFLALPNWPVFNVADASICAAAALIIVLAMRGRRWDGTIEESGRRPDSDKPDTSARQAHEPPQTPGVAADEPALRKAE
ncbi:signal peptidase II [Actinopolymorpha cephalotaxi]|uniref:Lipoprotein signal peptidase n=1 Tax=Actinopolymorpha cephalotaxi TaxID=504797 RepID=A0A1I2W8T9_9ACTN|nr:signal peptidase II [Actinopolymorpha cephalotaxi]NYH82695.1 signal peptidase II [Actinopolymorpha cephalotaxi]SFG97722.1 signal peptidase II [Actinopolymorpha cephalotaxi]